jgi:hypothetical protein
MVLLFNKLGRIDLLLLFGKLGGIDILLLSEFGFVVQQIKRHQLGCIIQ